MQDRHRRIVEIFLLRTAGPYIRVIRFILALSRCPVCPQQRPNGGHSRNVEFMRTRHGHGYVKYSRTFASNARGLKGLLT